MFRNALLVFISLSSAGCLQQGPALGPWQVGPAVAEEIPLGYSAEGRLIESYRFGRGRNPVLIFGGFHGDEQVSVHIARELIDLLNARPTLRNGCSVVIVPNVNPDGYERDTRKNARGVDLNRNFSTANWESSDPTSGSHGGPSPLSEPESQIVFDLVGELEPSSIISIHSITRGRHCNNFDGPAKALAERMAARNGYPVKGSIGYPTPGSFGTWAGKELQIPTLTLELPAGANPEECWADNRQALVSAIQGESRRDRLAK